MKFNEMVFVEELSEYRETSELEENQTVRNISGMQVREEYLANNKPLPEWFTRPEVARILMDAMCLDTSKGTAFGLRVSVPRKNQP